MANCRFIDRLGVTEQEFLQETKGEYNTSFFHIYTKGDFDTDLSQISQTDRGTFIHEYIHYWQNIATLWGLSTSIFCYDCMQKLIEEFKTLDEITLPYSITYSESMKRRRDIFNIGYGETNDNLFVNKKINPANRIQIKFGIYSVGERTIPTVSLIIVFNDGITYDIALGAHIIKESMAALYQSLVDPAAGHDDMPYNIVRMLCLHNYPSLYDNKKLLICCCHASLFSMTPGNTLINLLSKAEKEKISDGMQLFCEYINESSISAGGKNDISILDFFDGMANRFLMKLDKNLRSELDYIKTVLNRVLLSNKMLPLLTVLYEEPSDTISIDNLNSIIRWLGIPFVHSLTQGHYFPSTTKKVDDPNTDVSEDASMDVLELIALEAMFKFLTKECPFRCCPLYGMMCCDSSYSKPECFETPWFGDDCVFTLVSESLNLKDKNIHW